MLNFFICINSLKTHRPCGVKLSLPAPFLTGQRLRERESTTGWRRRRGVLVLWVWVEVHEGKGGGVEGGGGGG